MKCSQLNNIMVFHGNLFNSGRSSTTIKNLFGRSKTPEIAWGNTDRAKYFLVFFLFQTKYNRIQNCTGARQSEGETDFMR
jgi:hypothetical protein